MFCSAILNSPPIHLKMFKCITSTIHHFSLFTNTASGLNGSLLPGSPGIGTASSKLNKFQSKFLNREVFKDRHFSEIWGLFHFKILPIKILPILASPRLEI